MHTPTESSARKPRAVLTMKPATLAFVSLKLQVGLRLLPVNAVLLRREETRLLNPAHVANLAESMHVLGNLQPIVIDTEGYLLAGGHRLAALQILSESDPQVRRSVFLRRCGPETPELLSIAKRIADLGDAPMDGRFQDEAIFVQVENVASHTDGTQRSLAIELAENHLRRKISREEIAATAERLRAVGYKSTSGRPRAGERTVLDALQVALGISRRQIQRIIANKPKKVKYAWDAARASLKRAATRAKELAQANDSDEGKAILFAAEQVLKAVG